MIFKNVFITRTVYYIIQNSTLHDLLHLNNTNKTQYFYLSHRHELFEPLFNYNNNYAKCNRPRCIFMERSATSYGHSTAFNVKLEKISSVAQMRAKKMIK